ncbi:MAG: ABC transporter permease [Deltaproteobacteria bacterium]|nr:MAG: ABC transporter permease [Deltaproteobacteria bacterium]
MEGLIVAVVHRTLVAGTPLLLGTLGEIVAERAGVLNLGVEGMMAVGAVSAFTTTFVTGNIMLGILVAVLMGTLLSLIHAFVSVTLKGNQVVSGLALVMFGLGLSGLWGKSFIGTPLPVRIHDISIPLLSNIPYLGPMLFHQDPFLYAALIMGVIFWFGLTHTRWGIVIRSVGENPAASESQGISVSVVQYVSVMVGGALAGLAGAHLSLSYSRAWAEGMTVGRGWIVIALTIFALWNPLRAYIGAFLFGGIFVLQYLLQPLGIPPNILGMLPYLITLIVLVWAVIGKDARRHAAPAMLGEAYIRGET